MVESSSAAPAWTAEPTLVTYHPSAALRATDTAAAIRQAIEADLRRAHRIANGDDDVRR